MSGQQHDWNFALIFNAAQVAEHFWIYIDLLVDTFEYFVKSPSHKPYHWHSELTDYFIYNLLSFL